MKKLLLLVSLIVLSIAGFSQTNSYPATGPVVVNGVNITGFSQTARLVLAAANKIQMIMPDGSVAYEIVPGSFDVQGYQISSLQNGGLFGSTGGSGIALITTTGKNWFNYISGRSVFGPGITDNGVDQVQVKGAVKADSIYVGGSAVGDVLSDPNGTGYFKPHVPAGGAGGMFKPTSITPLGCSGVTFDTCTYVRIGNQFIVNISGKFTPTATGAPVQLYITYPLGNLAVYGPWHAPVSIALATAGIPQFIGTVLPGSVGSGPVTQCMVVQWLATTNAQVSFGYTVVFTCNCLF